jgi:hypothetical protein
LAPSHPNTTTATTRSFPPRTPSLLEAELSEARLHTEPLSFEPDRNWLK